MITYCPQRVLHCPPLAFPLPYLRGEVPEINVKREVDGMSDTPPLSARETLSEWAERAWQARREQEPRNNTGRVAPDNGARDADTLEDAIKQRATKWMEEGRFLMGLLEELLNENEQLRNRAATFEQDLQRLQERVNENEQSKARAATLEQDLQRLQERVNENEQSKARAATPEQDLERLQERVNENEQSKAKAAALEQDLERLQELVDENEQLRDRAAALEQDLERLRHEQGGLQPEREDIVEVAPKGDLDMASVSQMKLQDYINAGRIKLVLDLESIEYIDSAGLGEIVRAMKRARDAGGDLRLCGVHGQVGKIIEITGLNKAIAVYSTREEAVASWSS